MNRTDSMILMAVASRLAEDARSLKETNSVGGKLATNERWKNAAIEECKQLRRYAKELRRIAKQP